ncbi:extracellular ligand-binding receptor [Anopheles sinensis]|uniref:Extracellular ligand-binding receptor n=1 Tax=Anopheles sinensis TaxID=74873 RepID=A0A084W4P2_ANOSI|nr:extracellular ligand-binding receptor [Anopheles sinensis]
MTGSHNLMTLHIRTLALLRDSLPPNHRKRSSFLPQRHPPPFPVTHYVAVAKANLLSSLCPFFICQQPGNPCLDRGPEGTLLPSGAREQRCVHYRTDSFSLSSQTPPPYLFINRRLLIIGPKEGSKPQDTERRIIVFASSSPSVPDVPPHPVLAGG